MYKIVCLFLFFGCIYCETEVIQPNVQSTYYGFTVSIPDVSGIEKVSFLGAIKRRGDSPRFFMENLKKPVGKKWVLRSDQLKVKIGDVVYIWADYNVNGADYSSDAVQIYYTSEKPHQKSLRKYERKPRSLRTRTCVDVKRNNGVYRLLQCHPPPLPIRKNDNFIMMPLKRITRAAQYSGYSRNNQYQQYNRQRPRNTTQYNWVPYGNTTEYNWQTYNNTTEYNWQTPRSVTRTTTIPKTREVVERIGF